jgi:hypothetical protein
LGILFRGDVTNRQILPTVYFIWGFLSYILYGDFVNSWSSKLTLPSFGSRWPRSAPHGKRQFPEVEGSLRNWRFYST